MLDTILQIQTYLKKNKLDAYLVFSSDDHGSEYVVEHYKARAYLSNFTGSAGTLLVTVDSANLWTDGRYFLQASNQLKDTGITLMKMGQPNVPTIPKFISQLGKHPKVAFDFRCAVSSFASLLKEVGCELVNEENLIDEIWINRPPVPSTPCYLLSDKESGQSRLQKIADLRDAFEKEKCEATLLSSLDDIAWLLNMRSSDIPYNPVAYAFFYLTKKTATLYIEEKKLSCEIQKIFSDEGIEVKPYLDVYSDMKKVKDQVLVDDNKLNYALDLSISYKFDCGTYPTVAAKAKKNPTEIENIREAHKKDAVAMIRFMRYIKENHKKIPMTEISLSNKLEELRREDPTCLDLSFDTICGWREHGAIIHYSATKESSSNITDNGLLLVDSGAQYKYGTTDITRTYVLGEATYDEKLDFTLVLKGHINLARAVFPKGTDGKTLDILARQPLQRYGKDFRHGTGHGVGYLLNVHEGPQRIASGGNHVPLEIGMLTSNEPGYYADGSHGIRHESLVLTQLERENEYGTFYSFETVTLVPFDTDGILVELLTNEERDWLNAYHARCREVIGPRLSLDDKDYLNQITKAI